MADLPVDVTGHSAEQHRQDSNEIHARLNAAIYSSSEASLNAAFIKAANLKRPLIITPGTYTLTALTAMLMNGLTDVHVSAHNVLFVAGADMPALFEMRDCVRCSWRGGWFRVPDNIAVPNAVYVNRDMVQATRNTFNDITVEGAYQTGIRIGKQGSGLQCDHMWFTNVECIGRGLPGQVGVYVGDGVWGNCLNHTFTNLMCTGHETHVKVDRTNAYITNGFFAYASETDLFLDATNFSLRGGRSEGSKRFIVTAGPSSGITQLTVSDYDWHGENIASDGEWIQHKTGGTLSLDAVRALSAAHAPVIRSSAGVPKAISMHSLSTIAAVADAFVGSAILEGLYVQHDVNGSVVGITKL
jgi:hypothetical protein